MVSKTSSMPGSKSGARRGHHGMSCCSPPAHLGWRDCRHNRLPFFSPLFCFDDGMLLPKAEAFLLGVSSQPPSPHCRYADSASKGMESPDGSIPVLSLPLLWFRRSPFPLLSGIVMGCGRPAGLNWTHRSGGAHQRPAIPDHHCHALQQLVACFEWRVSQALLCSFFLPSFCFILLSFAFQSFQQVFGVAMFLRLTWQIYI